MDHDIFEAHFMGKEIQGSDILSDNDMVDLGGSFYSYKIYNKPKVLKNRNYKIEDIKENVVFLKEVN